MILKVKKLAENAKLPSRAHSTDAGLDLYVSETTTIKARSRKLVHTGIAIDVPEDFAAFVIGRSGNTIKRGLQVATGVIDHGYHDEIGIMMFNTTDEDITIMEGERGAQLLIFLQPSAFPQESCDISDFDRGGGFASTGK